MLMKKDTGNTMKTPFLIFRKKTYLNGIECEKQLEKKILLKRRKIYTYIN